MKHRYIMLMGSTSILGGGGLFCKTCGSLYMGGVWTLFARTMVNSFMYISNFSDPYFRTSSHNRVAGRRKEILRCQRKFQLFSKFSLEVHAKRAEKNFPSNFIVLTLIFSFFKHCKI